MIRGMLPHKQPRGIVAYGKVKCHIGVPEELEGKEAITIPKANISKTQTLKYIRLKEVSKLLGRRKWKN